MTIVMKTILLLSVYTKELTNHDLLVIFISSCLTMFDDSLIFKKQFNCDISIFETDISGHGGGGMCTLHMTCGCGGSHCYVIM